MTLLGSVTPQCLSLIVKDDLSNGAPIEMHADLGGVSRLTTAGHPNMPSPIAPGGYCELFTGLDGTPLGEINFFINKLEWSFVIEVFTSTPEVVGEIRDGANPVQVVKPTVTPVGDDFKASFLLPAASTGAGPELRVYFRQDWPEQQPAPETTWNFVRANVFRYSP